jgi:hypothetical protein
VRPALVFVQTRAPECRGVARLLRTTDKRVTRARGRASVSPCVSGRAPVRVSDARASSRATTRQAVPFATARSHEAAGPETACGRRGAATRPSSACRVRLAGRRLWALDGRQAAGRDRRRPALRHRSQARARRRRRRHPSQLRQHPSTPAGPATVSSNTAIHRIALTRARCHRETQAYLARKRAEGKTGLEAMRCLKRHLTRRVWHLLQPPTAHPKIALPTSIS